jgi:uncharacterized protein YcbK (DUF882 family)
MNIFVRCAMIFAAALALAGCQTTEGPRKFASSMRAMDVSKPDNSWKKDFVNPFMEEHAHEPESASWTRRAKWLRRQQEERRVALAGRNEGGAPSVTGSIRRSGDRSINSIRAMAMRLAPAGVNVALLSPMVSKRRQARIDCIPAKLRMILNTVAWHYGKKVHIQSGYRSRRHNRRVGGARHSYHLRCQAVDIQVRGVSKYKLARFLKSLPGRGGVGTYCNVSTVHIDVGPRRSWHYGCGMKSLAMRRLARYRRSLRR